MECIPPVHIRAWWYSSLRERTSRRIYVRTIKFHHVFPNDFFALSSASPMLRSSWTRQHTICSSLSTRLISYSSSMPIAVTVRRSNSPNEFDHPSKRPRVDEHESERENLSPGHERIGEIGSVRSLKAGPSITSVSEDELVEENMRTPIEFSKTYSHELDYRNKLVLAPMVRTGSCKLIRQQKYH